MNGLAFQFLVLMASKRRLVCEDLIAINSEDKQSIKNQYAMILWMMACTD